MKDFYQILGVDASASADEIRKAYRKLAVQYHPDRNPDPAATARFQEINEAHDTLSDAGKRAQYDQMRHMGGGQAPGGFEFHMNMGGGHNFHDIFEQMFRQHGFAGGFSPFGQQRPQRNPDTQIQVMITLEEAFVGKQMPIQFTDSQGKPVNVMVNIPPGTEHGTRIRYAGNGNRVHVNLPPGDLYVIITIEPHARFQRDGAHLIAQETISLWESLVGTQKTIVGIDGVQIQVTVPPLSTSDTVLRVAEKGMPQRTDRKRRGDLYVRLKISMPAHLTQQQQDQISSWAKS